MRRVAEASGVGGSAVNRDDGSVEVLLEGPADAVEGVIAYCADGPGNAEVSGVEIEHEEPQGVSGFRTG